MKNQRKEVIKIKKVILIILIIVTSLNYVSADEYPEVTNDIEIRYRWYKEVISKEGDYYPLRKITTEDRYDQNNFKYIGNANVYSSNNCNLPREYYLINEITIRTYKKTYDASYVLIDNIDYDNNVQIYHNNNKINFSIISSDNNQLKINLNNSYMCDNFLFFIDTDTQYTISLYHDLSFQNKIISKTIENQKISIPDATWITKDTKFTTYIHSEKYEESPFLKIIEEKTNCTYKEKYVYKYNVTKEYYDDNYYTNLDGYIKDITDYKIYYKGEPIVNTVEIVKEKTVKVPQIEYIYIENETKENDSSQQTTCENKIEKVIETKTEVIEKEIYKIPKTIYIVLIILIITIIILIIKKYRKYVE